PCTSIYKPRPERSGACGLGTKLCRTRRRRYRRNQSRSPARSITRRSAFRSAGAKGGCAENTIVKIDNFFTELKRRKVFKVGAAYLIVAWLAVQAASIGFPAFDAPPWALR